MAGSTQRSGGIIEGINVTPLVDITLVLLLIFIVTAKMVVSPAVPVELPQASNTESVQTIFSVAIAADGSLSVDGSECSASELEAKAVEALKRDSSLRAVIQADGAVPHRQVIAVLDQLRTAGIDRVAFGATQAEAEEVASE